MKPTEDDELNKLLDEILRSGPSLDDLISELEDGQNLDDLLNEIAADASALDAILAEISTTGPDLDALLKDANADLAAIYARMAEDDGVIDDDDD